jgi:murein DD-endopeptidase MepM/ murein hydrolase activator NlpD
MDKKYSILILPWRGTWMRRLVFSQKLIRYFLSGGIVLLVFAGWLLGDYFWLKLQSEEARLMRVEVQAQRERLSALQERTKDIQGLLANWKGLEERVQASLPPQRRSSNNGHHVVDELESSLALLESKLKGLIVSIPSEWPASGRVTSGVGMRPSPWTGKAEFHSGIDIPNPIGTPIHAPGDGVVDFAGESNGNGTALILDHGQGITTLYAHLSATHVKKGDRVRRGERIAAVGNTGNSTSPHLHYEVRVNGVPIDPRDHLLK